jgi:acetylornithine/succinyldiaminopimelate/putrescine aminotransferase
MGMLSNSGLDREFLSSTTRQAVALEKANKIAVHDARREDRRNILSFDGSFHCGQDDCPVCASPRRQPLDPKAGLS